MTQRRSGAVGWIPPAGERHDLSASAPVGWLGLSEGVVTAERSAESAEPASGEVSRETPIDPLTAPLADVSRETESPDTPIAQEAERAVRLLSSAQDRVFPRPAETRIITVANQKGGVGKTTSTVNLATALAMHGVRVLAIDLDPQGNASTGFGVPHTQGTPSIYDVLVDERPLAEVAVEVSAHLMCVPATIDLAGAEVELVSFDGRETLLRGALARYLNDVSRETRPDYVLIDCPPSLGLLTLNALTAGSEVLIPIQCEYYALEGLGQLLNNIELVRSHLNPPLEVSTILLTMYDARTKLAEQVAQEVRNHFGDRVLRAVVPRSVRVSEAPGFGQSVITYDPGSRGALSYVDAAEELAERARTESAPA
jgi:chromosome partitioning protein